MDINFNGFQENVLTLKCDSTVSEGDLVSVTASGTVSKASADGNFDGVCVSIENDGYGSIQISGYTEVPASGTVTINLGYTKLVSTTGGVKMGSSGHERLVLYRDDTTVGFIL